MKKIIFLFVTMQAFIFCFSQNVGVGTPTPLGKLHIKSQTTQSQLVLDAAEAQGNFPRLIFRDNSGTEQLHLRANKDGLFLGLYAGQSNSPFLSGYHNLGIGYSALQYNQDGFNNTALGGHSALQSNISGSYNTAVGTNALRYANAGDNTAVGESALLTNVSGNENTAIGRLALYSNYSGHYNTAVGFESSYSNSGSGYYNVALGHRALYNNTVGTRNIAIGAGTGTSGGTYGNTISIGNHNYLQAASNQAFLGNLNTLWNGGNVGWTTFSDGRIKKDIREDVKGLSFILRLRPVTYNRSTKAALDITGNKDDALYYEGKYDIENIRFTGFIAQEVATAAQEVGYDFQGVQIPTNTKQLYSLSYEAFTVPLVKAVQEQQVEIEALKAKNDELNARLEKLEKYLKNPGL